MVRPFSDMKLIYEKFISICDAAEEHLDDCLAVIGSGQCRVAYGDRAVSLNSKLMPTGKTMHYLHLSGSRRTLFELDMIWENTRPSVAVAVKIGQFTTTFRNNPANRIVRLARSPGHDIDIFTTEEEFFQYSLIFEYKHTLDEYHAMLDWTETLPENKNIVDDESLNERSFTDEEYLSFLSALDTLLAQIQCGADYNPYTGLPTGVL